MRIERLIYSVLIIILAVIACINWRKAALFKADNEELHLRIESLEVELETNLRLTKRAQDKLNSLRAETSATLLPAVGSPSDTARTAAQP